jgi:methionine salvage enolase-phosphatase E1
MSTTIATITAIIGTISGTIAAQKWVFPYIEKFINRKHTKDIETLDVNKKLLAVETDNNKLYENQINFFVSQIDNLQKQLLRKTDEINEMNIQCDTLRAAMLLLQKELFEEKQKNVKLEESFCDYANCPNRIRHINLTKINKHGK